MDVRLLCMLYVVRYKSLRRVLANAVESLCV
jgi:hypothetical protein